MSQTAETKNDQAPRERLIGRDRELRALRGLLDGVQARGAAVVVRGAAGIGKSLLVESASDWARACRFQILTTAGVQCETHLPFAGLHQLLQPMLSGVDHLPSPQRRAVEAAFGIAEAPAPELFLIALATLHLLSDAASDEPLLLIVEDAQWLDRPTAELLTFVSRRLESDPIIVLVAIRDGFESPLDAAGLQELRLGRLDTASSAELLDTRDPGVGPSIRARVLEEAEGNPLALVELPAAMLETDVFGAPISPTRLPLTTRLEAAFSARTDDLPDATGKALLVTAADDQGLLRDVLAATAILAGGDHSDAVMLPAIEAGLVKLELPYVRFSHPLMRSAIYQAASVPERAATHRALAKVMTEEPDRRVWHLAASATGPDEEVALELDEAAARAQRRGAISIAIKALQRGAQLTNDPTLRAGRVLQAAEISFEQGRPEVALRLMGEVRKISLSSRDQARLLCLEAVLGAADIGDPLRLRSLVSAADDMRIDGESALSLRLLSAAAMRCYLGGDPGYEARHNVAEVVEKLDLPGDDAWVLRTLAYATPIERGAVLLNRLSHIAPGDTNDPVEMYNLGTAAGILGACDIAAKFVNAAIVELRKRGHLALLAQALLVRAWNETHLGNLNLAVPAAEEARRLGEESGQPIFQASAHVTQAVQAALRGDTQTADSLASRVEAVAVATGTTALRVVVQLARGLASLADGDYEGAYDRLYRVFDPQDPAYHFTRYWAIGDIVEAAVHCGREESARRLLADMESIGEEAPLPCLHVGLAYARPLLAQQAYAEPLFQSALAQDLRSWPFFRGRLLLAYGSWLRRQRRLAESRTPLRIARETFDALGAVPWGERARQELTAAGETSRRRKAGAWDQLTPQELQIAQMAAEGLSNREIGQQLYLSHRTVGSHLYHVFPKLGVTSRAQLHQALSTTPA